MPSFSMASRPTSRLNTGLSTTEYESKSGVCANTIGTVTRSVDWSKPPLPNLYVSSSGVTLTRCPKPRDRQSLRYAKSHFLPATVKQQAVSITPRGPSRLATPAPEAKSEVQEVGGDVMVSAKQDASWLLPVLSSQTVDVSIYHVLAACLG